MEENGFFLDFAIKFSLLKFAFIHILNFNSVGYELVFFFFSSEEASDKKIAHCSHTIHGQFWESCAVSPCINLTQ